MAGSDDAGSEDRVTELEFELSDPEYFFIGLAGDEGCRVRSDEFLRLSTGEVIEFFTAFDCRFQAIRDRASEAPTIETCRVLAEWGNEVVFRIERTGRSIRESLEGVGAIPTSIRATDGAGRVLAEVPAGTEARTVIGTFIDHHPTATLAATRRTDAPAPVFTPRGVREMLQHQVTDRQLEVVETAYRNGYFERPRARSGEEIAADIGISSATFSQHLRAAHRNLLGMVVDADRGGETLE